MEMTGELTYTNYKEIRTQSDYVRFTSSLIRRGVVITCGWLLFEIDCNLRIVVLVLMAQLTVQRAVCVAV